MIDFDYDSRDNLSVETGDHCSPLCLLSIDNVNQARSASRDNKNESLSTDDPKRSLTSKPGETSGNTTKLAGSCTFVGKVIICRD